MCLLHQVHLLRYLNLAIIVRIFLLVAVQFLQFLLDKFLFEFLQVGVYSLEVLNNLNDLITSGFQFIFELTELLLVLFHSLILSLLNHFFGCFRSNFFAFFLLCSLFRLLPFLLKTIWPCLESPRPKLSKTFSRLFIHP